MYVTYYKRRMLMIAFFSLVVICQIFIIIYWKEAKYWTILNLVALFLCLVANGRNNFNKMVAEEVNMLLEKNNKKATEIITDKKIAHLPTIVQKWLHFSGVIGKKNMHLVKLKQRGELRTKPNNSWMPFNAIQYFNSKQISFVWSAKIKAMPLITLFGRDKLVNGEGEMLIKLGGFFSVVEEGKNHKIDTGAMVRYLAEICWFPSAALHETIFWETISDTSAKAIFKIENKVVSGIFNFSDEGEILSFEATRFYGGTEDSKPEKWYVEMMSYKNFNGVVIPNTSKVIWKLKEGDFHWLTVEIIDIEFNPNY